MLSFLTIIWILYETRSLSAQPPQGCKSTLLSNLPDGAFTASSVVTQKYSAAAARMAPSDGRLQYRAWCPDNVQPHEEKEFLEVDLGQQSFVKLIITKGLSTADKGGLYLTPFYYIRYRREDPTSRWIKYQNINGTMRIKGNLDAQTERYVSMNPPFVARWIRIYPFTQERQPVCLKLEIVGCSANGVVEYQAPRGNFVTKAPKDRLVDFTYDNPENRHSQIRDSHHEVFNAGGLGKLADGKPDHETDTEPLESNDFVGWKRSDDALDAISYERIVFRFDGIYNFTSVSMLFANQVGNEVSRPRLVEVRLSRKFPRASPTDPATTFTASHVFPVLKNTLPKTEWVHVGLLDTLTESPNTNMSSKYYNVANFVELRVYYAGRWIALGEVTFHNVRVQIPPGLVLDKEHNEALTTPVPSQSLNSSLGITGSQYSLATLQPHTYALVVGLGCLATVLIILVLALFVHWRRRAFLSKHKIDELNHSFQHPFTMPLIKTAAQPTNSVNTEADQKWEFYNNSNAFQVPMYLNGENAAYAPSSTTVIPQFLLQQPPIGVPGSLMLPNYMRAQIQSNPANELAPQEQPANSGGDNETRAPLFPFFQSASSGLTPESSAVYTTVSENDPYVNGTPRPNQMLRIPPPPSLPLPPTPTQPHSVAERTPPWTGAGFSREKDYIQRRELNSNGSSDLNTFYRYSIPLNAAFPATPVYSAPVWVAGTMDSVTIGHFYGQHQTTLQDHPPLPQETPELNEYLSGTPVSSIIYGGFYGMRDPRQTEHTPGALSN
ncbi:discoidin domain containing receptor 2 [Echinococcus multilocularis]|uniref:Discoidin domain containing receptor 2 n=1 Tax=Echinococcus multilocularis TaxID=6211 RepID=A0A087VXD7_ECHMU|nr:discoidin domain containing receptor 2 [Echinococcus multilocularis]